MDFSDALRQLRRGRRIARTDAPDGVYMYFVPAQTVHVKEPPLSDFMMKGVPVGHSAHFMCRNRDGSVEPWSPDADDLIAQWKLVGAEEENEPRFAFVAGNE
jgi:hypothetical protein